MQMKRPTFNQSFSVTVTQLTNQVVVTTRKARQTTSFLFRVWMETLEGSLKEQEVEVEAENEEEEEKEEEAEEEEEEKEEETEKEEEKDMEGKEDRREEEDKKLTEYI